MITVIPQDCEIAPDLSRGTIVIESDKSGPPFHEAFEELKDMATRNHALQYATTVGIAGALMNGNLDGPYAVNKEGVPLDRVRGPGNTALPPSHELMQPHRYRISVPVHKKM